MKVRSQGLEERREGGLACSVGAGLRQASHGRKARHSHERTAPPRHHSLHPCHERGERAHHVHPQDGLHVLPRELVRRLGLANPRVGNHEVEPPSLSFPPPNGFPHLVGLSDVEHTEICLSALRPDGLHQGLKLGLSSGRRDHVRASPPKPLRKSTTNPARCARNECVLEGLHGRHATRLNLRLSTRPRTSFLIRSEAPGGESNPCLLFEWRGGCSFPRGVVSMRPFDAQPVAMQLPAFALAPNQALFEERAWVWGYPSRRRGVSGVSRGERGEGAFRKPP
jgi:hypothetical protein